MVSRIIPWLIFGAFAFLLVGNNANSKLGMIDDHEIPRYLGSDKKITVQEIPHLISQTEVGKWGSSVRYRPSYYITRIVEAALWRDNAVLWYLARYLFLVISLWMAWKLLSGIYPGIVAYLCVFYLLTLNFWPDILTRLGPAEIYAVPATLLFIYGMSINNLYLITLGYVMSIGTKENFLILFPIMLGWSLYLYFTKKITPRTVASIVIMTAFTLVIAGAIYFATGKSGVDIYGAHISYSLRIKGFLVAIPSIITKYYLTFPLLIAGFAALNSTVVGMLYGVERMANQKSNKYVLFILASLMIIASQYVFYNNQLPSNWRYDYPLMLTYPLMYLFSLKILLIYLGRFAESDLPKYLAYSLMIYYLGTQITNIGYSHIQKAATMNSSVTNKFYSEIQKVTHSDLITPSTNVVIVSEQYIDFEAISSISRYIDYYTEHGVIMLAYTPQTGNLGELGGILQGRLINVQNGVNGVDGFFELLSAYTKPESNCVSIVIGLAKNNPECPKIANF